MIKRNVVMFLKHRPLFFEELEITDKFTRGWVVNGAWNLYIKHVEFGGRLCFFGEEEAEESCFMHCDQSEIRYVEIPKEHAWHYNDAINYAQG
jgi:hypothetical protein